MEFGIRPIDLTKNRQAGFYIRRPEFEEEL